MAWKSYGLFTLEAASWRFSSRSWTTRSPGKGIAALSDVKVSICASSCLQRQLVCSSGSSGMREVAAAGLWQQPVERRVGQEGKVGPAKRVPYARVSTCHYSQHSGSRSGSGLSKIRIKVQDQRSEPFKDQAQRKRNSSEACLLVIEPLPSTSTYAALIAAMV